MRTESSPSYSTCSGTSPSTLSIAETLIGFDTVSRNSNLGLIEWTRDHLKALGIDSRLTYDKSRGKANLLATLGPAEGTAGQGPAEGGLVLCGHTDVVPIDGQDWHTDPFKAVQKDGRLYGRGSADMKGYIACVLAAVPAFLAAPLKRPVHLAFTFDEEVGCLGVPFLVEDMARAGIRPAGCIIGEPTLMQVMIGHKGARWYRCRVRGLEAHSSMTPSGVNAIEYASLIVARIREVARELGESGPRNENFAVPFATLSTGLISGGTATNIIPLECEFQFDIRYLPGMNPEEPIGRVRSFAQSLEPEMKQRAADAGISIEMVADTPDLDTPADDRLAYLGTRLARSMKTGHVSFGTDGGHFQRAGVPAIVLGPGSIEQAHKPDEYIELEQLARCEEFLEKLKLELCI